MSADKRLLEFLQYRKNKQLYTLEEQKYIAKSFSLPCPLLNKGGEAIECFELIVEYQSYLLLNHCLLMRLKVPRLWLCCALIVQQNYQL